MEFRTRDEAMRGRGVTLADLITAVPDFVIAGAFLVAWIAPRWIGVDWIAYLLLIMLLEFIIIHSSAFMGSVLLGDASRWAKVRNTLLFGVFYSLFALAFAAAFDQWWPVAAFWLLTLNRLLGAVVGQAPEGGERALVRVGWAVSAVCYLLGAFATTTLPVPALGISPDVIAAARLPGGGIWIEEPYRVLAFGVIYFGGIGVWELHAHRWMRPLARGPRILRTGTDA